MQLINGDCLEVLKEIPSESVDLLVTDCPYKITTGGSTIEPKSNEMHGVLERRSEDKLVKKGKIFKNNDIEFSEWLPEVYRVLKDDSHAYIMINPRNLKELWEECEKVGFKFQQLLVWDKQNVIANHYYMNAYELILMVRKGKAKDINDMGTSNLLRVPNVRHKEHPTEKPVELMKILIRNSSNEGDVVLDPFMGVGATCIACKRLKRDFIGVEIDKEYFDIANKRLKEEDMQISFFD